MPNIWRVESASGFGPYRKNEHGKNAADKCDLLWENNNPQHPGPREHNEINTPLSNFERGVHIFAFKSLEQYLEWFNKKEWRNVLTEYGCLLVKYDCPESHVLKGNKQICFVKDEATKLETRECNYV